MYFAPMLQLEKYVTCPKKRSALQSIFIEEMVNIHFGQAWDINWHNSEKNYVPSFEQYF